MSGTGRPKSAMFNASQPPSHAAATPPRPRTKRPRVEQLGARPRTRLGARSASRIQRWWRAAVRMVCTVNSTEESGTRGFLRCGGRDVRCPISQERVPTASAFKFVTAAGRVAGFDAAAFVGYLRATGRFICPCSQEPLGAHVVRRLERAGVRCGAPNARGLLTLYHGRAALARRVAESTHRVLAIESACQSVLTEMLEVCADDDLSQSEARRELDRVLLPEYRAICADFAYVKREACEAMLRADIEKLRRIAVIPGEDTHGLLFMVVAAVSDRLAYCEHEGRMSRAEERLDRLLTAASVSQLGRMFSGSSFLANNMSGLRFVAPAVNMQMRSTNAAATDGAGTGARAGAGTDNNGTGLLGSARGGAAPHLVGARVPGQDVIQLLGITPGPLFARSLDMLISTSTDAQADTARRGRNSRSHATDEREE